jgi:hypothetical protein
MTIRTHSLMALALCLATLPAARGDNLDAALFRQAPKVMQFLKDRHYQNVGVLKFRVQKGNQPLSFRVGPLNTNLASRLENALVLVDDKAHPVGIIHGADKVAQDNRLPTYNRSDAGMAKLFQQRFPLAWGDQTVQADAFLTGTVRVPADMRHATVTVQAFGPNADRLDDVVSFTVEVDRTLLGDLGQSFFLSSRSLKTRRTRALDLEAADDAAVRDQSPGQTSTQTAERLLDFEICYDGRPQPYGPDPNNGGKFLVAEPQQGQRVTFVLRNLTQERIAVALMLNGKNSLYEQEGEPANCSLWIPKPSETIEVKGFQVDQNTIKPFRVLSPAESEAMAYSDNLGLISVYVFRSMKDKPMDQDRADTVTPEDSSSGMTVDGGRSLTLRNPPHLPRSSRSLEERQQLLKQHLHPARRSRGVISSQDTTEAYQVMYEDFPNPELQYPLMIRYYKPRGR